MCYRHRVRQGGERRRGKLSEKRLAAKALRRRSGSGHNHDEVLNQQTPRD
jgi:hypothetical protein